VIDPSGRSSRPSPLRVTARCGSCRLPLQRLTASPRRPSTVTRARPGSRGVRVPFRGSWCRPSSAFMAPSAPPSPFETATGFSSTDLTPETKVPEDPLLEFASPSEPNRVSAARAPVTTIVACATTATRPAREIASPGFLAPSNALRRVPLVDPTAGFRQQQGGWRSPGPHRCRPQGSCPSRRFWPRSRHARTPCGARRSPWRPDASRSCFIPLASLESPFRAFPSRGAVPALAGLLLPCGFAFDRPTARHGPRCSRPLSPSRRPLAAAGPKARRTGRPGRRFPGVARASHVARYRARLRRLVSNRPGSPDTAAGTPTSKLCSPRESVLVTTASLARLRSSGRCSPGRFPL